MDRDGEIVDNLNRKEQIFFLHQATQSLRHPQHEAGSSPSTQLQSSMRRDSDGQMLPSWWFHGFEPVWKPFIQWLCRQKPMTVVEFERAASQVPGLTDVEKTIAISAFRHQRNHGLVPSHNTTAFHGERSLSAV